MCRAACIAHGAAAWGCGDRAAPGTELLGLNLKRCPPIVLLGASLELRGVSLELLRASLELHGASLWKWERHAGGPVLGMLVVQDRSGSLGQNGNGGDGDMVLCCRCWRFCSLSLSLSLLPPLSPAPSPCYLFI